MYRLAISTRGWLWALRGPGRGRGGVGSPQAKARACRMPCRLLHLQSDNTTRAPRQPLLPPCSPGSCTGGPAPFAALRGEDAHEARLQLGLAARLPHAQLVEHLCQLPYAQRQYVALRGQAQ